LREPTGGAPAPLSRLPQLAAAIPSARRT